MSDKVYSVQARRYGSWLVCSGREPRKSYRVVAFTGDYERAKVMAALRCVCPTTIAACEAAAAKAVIPDEPVEA